MKQWNTYMNWKMHYSIYINLSEFIFLGDARYWSLTFNYLGCRAMTFQDGFKLLYIISQPDYKQVYYCLSKL